MERKQVQVIPDLLEIYHQVHFKNMLRWEFGCGVEKKKTVIQNEIDLR